MLNSYGGWLFGVHIKFIDEFVEGLDVFGIGLKFVRGLLRFVVSFFEFL